MSVIKFISKTCLSLNVALPTGGSAHVAFSPLTGGGSVFYTDNENIVKGLKQHYMYGRAFHEDTIKEVAPTQEIPKKANDKDATGVVLPVKSLDEAKDYLCEHFGLSRTKLKGVDGVKKTAASYNITFEGI